MSLIAWLERMAAATIAFLDRVPTFIIDPPFIAPLLWELGRA